MTNFFPPVNETSYRKKLSKLEWNKLNSELKLSKPKVKGSLEKVEEMAIHRTMYYLWDKNYWVFREQQGKGPADVFAFKIINGEKKEYFIDVKGIHPNAKQKPKFKPRADLKFINRDRIIHRIVAIVYNWEIKFIEGFHANYKNLNEKHFKIN